MGDWGDILPGTLKGRSPQPCRERPCRLKATPGVDAEEAEENTLEDGTLETAIEVHVETSRNEARPGIYLMELRTSVCVHNYFYTYIHVYIYI